MMSVFAIRKSYVCGRQDPWIGHRLRGFNSVFLLVEKDKQVHTSHNRAMLT